MRNAPQATASPNRATPDQRSGGGDGLTVDLDGNVFATIPGGVGIFSPDGKQLGLLATGDRTAKLIQSISDPEVTNSICCGNARLLPSGNWLINWGGTGVLGIYRPNGKRLFKLTTPGEFSYRANPVPPGALTAEQLRRAMNAMNR